MCSSSLPGKGRPCHLAALCLLATLVWSAYSPPAAANPTVAESPQIWLVSYGPGEIYWQRFGHNAIWVRDPVRGLDHTFNFGFFDFAQERFFLRFLQGRLLYFSAAQPSVSEFASYIDENRSIRAQLLDFSARQAEALTDYLLLQSTPENREYLYDYYRNNCSTRVRDALDAALGGALARESAAIPADQTWRDQTRRLTAADFWLYLGLEIGLGAPVDRAISRWEEMFIPSVLADVVASVTVEHGSGSTPLVIEDLLLHESTLTPPPATVHAWWPRYLLASLAVLAGAWLLGRLAGPNWYPRLARGWFWVAGLAGLVLLYLWFGTDHAAARLNLNLLVFSPLWLWPAMRATGAGQSWPLALALSTVALLMPMLPPGQYTADVLAAFLPLNLAAGYILRRPAGQPRASGSDFGQ